MIATTVPIQYKYGQSFKIIPIADIHFDGFGKKSTCDYIKLKKDLARNVDDTTKILGIGDWFGGIIPSDTRRYNKDLDAAKTSAILDESVDGLVEIFKPYKNNIVCVGTGNHEETVLQRCGTNLLERFVQKLNPNILLMGYSWLLKLRFSENGHRVRSLIVRGHHGWGGGSKSEGSDITKYSHDVKFWNAQLFLYGHVHKIKVNPIEEGVMIGDNNWRTITKKMAICGTYQKTYTNNTVATYAEKAGYPPASISNPLIIATPGREFGVRVDVVV
jgi:hypothetical protein